MRALASLTTETTLRMEVVTSAVNYRDYATEAHKLVDKVIEDALRHFEPLRKDENEEENKIPSTLWPLSGEFTRNAGEKSIEEFIGTWRRGDNWKHCIDFLDHQEIDGGDKYRYRVTWSMPTRRKPIPRATASVYFTIFVPNAAPVSRTYILISSPVIFY